MIDFSPILEAIDIKLNSALSKAGYDKTIIGTIVEIIDVDAGLYLVSSQYSYFNVYSYNGIIYSEGDNVFITLPNSDSNLDKYIIGKVPESILEKIDASTGELDSFSSLGDIIIENEYSITNTKNSIEIAVTDEYNDMLKGGFAISPYFVCELLIEPHIPNPNKVNDYGIEFEFEFAATEVDGDIKDSLGHDYTKYYRTYRFGIDRMIGQPLSSLNDISMHQYTIFEIENAKNFNRIKSIRLYGDFNETSGGQEAAVAAINFLKIKFCSAQNLKAEMIQHDVSLGTNGQSPYITNDTSIEIEATYYINNTEFSSKDIEYYWFIQDATVTSKDKEKYHRYGGDGWCCLNSKESFDIVDFNSNNNLIKISEWKPGSSSIVVKGDEAKQYRNVFKCCTYYQGLVCESKILTIYNKAYMNKQADVSLVSKVRSFNNGDEKPNDSDRTNPNRYVETKILQFTDTAFVECHIANSIIINNPIYNWEKVDSLGHTIERLETKDTNNYITIYGSDIHEEMTIKCSVSDGGDFVGSNSIVLTVITSDLNLKLLSKQNIFNSLTNNSKRVGIYYVYRENDESDEFTPVQDWEIDLYPDDKLELYINATYIKTGSLTVGKGSNILFQADVDGTDHNGSPFVKIAGFNVTEKSLYNGKSAFNSSEKGIYIGTDGISLNWPNGYFKADSSGVAISGDINAISGSIGGFTLKNNILTSNNFGIDSSSSNNGIWLGGNTFSSAVFSVDKQGKLKATNAEITGKIIATSLELGSGVTIPADNITGLGTLIGNDYIYIPGKKEINGKEIDVVYIFNKKDTYQDSEGNYKPNNWNDYISITFKDPNGIVHTNVGIGHAEGDENGTGDSKEHYVEISSDGLLTANNAIIYGSIFANAGRIGGFTLQNNILSSTNSNFELNTNANREYIYLGGTSVDSAKFSVNEKGHVEAKDIKITGGLISLENSDKSKTLLLNVENGIELTAEGLAEGQKYNGYFELKGASLRLGTLWGKQEKTDAVHSNLSLSIKSSNPTAQSNDFGLTTDQNFSISASDFSIEANNFNIELRNRGNLNITSNFITIDSSAHEIKLVNTTNNPNNSYCNIFIDNTGNYPILKFWMNSEQDGLLLRSQRGTLSGTWSYNNSPLTSSDYYKKHSVEPLSYQYSYLFDNLEPCRFKYNDGTSDRYHTGFIAQEVEEAILKAGLTTQDVALFARDSEGSCSLRYSEIIALCVKEIQELKKKVYELSSR